MSLVDHYAVLGLTPGAPTAQVKAQFRHLAMAVHPDRNANDAECQERIKHINAAYEFLSDAARKADYDARFLTRHSAEPITFPVTSFPAATVRRAIRPKSFLTLVILCALFTGIVATAMVIIASVQSAGNTVPAASVTIIELPSKTDPIDASGEDGIGSGAVPLPDSPTAATPVKPVSDQPLWPGGFSSPSAIPASPRSDSPMTDPTPAATNQWPSVNDPAVR